ncbi:MAG: hypothetical protein KIT34_01735 [Cyanobacteria bacterium TGS_CYA1]|nr:hypothetical protein [Cyanobacteria bacterium TGS_CYA1]
MWCFLTSGMLFIASILGIILSISSIAAPFHYSLQFPIYLGLAPVEFESDTTSSIFSILLFGLSLAFSIFSPSYLANKNANELRLFWSGSLLFIASMAGVLFSGNAILFLICWEIMSLSSAALVASELLTKNTAKASLIYLSATRVATTLLALGFLCANNLFHSWNFSDWHLMRQEALIPALLITFGCFIKAGLWPFHLWVPYAYFAAPAPVAGLMSGVMKKIPIFLLVHLLCFREMADFWIPSFFLALGAISTLWGMIFALVQTDLKKILAYSSVENVGLIMLALGAHLVSLQLHVANLASLFLVAAIFHLFNHGVFKSLLFFASGSIYQNAHSTNLNNLGGLAKRMPGTFLLFLFGTMALCSLPPSNGFYSKWLIYEGLLQLVNSSNIAVAVCSVLLICVLIIAGALSLATMAKVVSVTFLGRTRTKLAQNATECSEFMIVGQGILACFCVLLGLFSAPICLYLVQILKLASFTPPSLFQFTIFSVFCIGIVYVSFLKQPKKSSIYSTWECGFGNLTRRMQVNPESFSQPIAALFSPLLRYRIKAEVSGKDRRHFPEKVVAESTTQSVLESKIYTPLVQAVAVLGKHINRLQAGSIHIYLFYLLITLLLLVVLELVR